MRAKLLILTIISAILLSLPFLVNNFGIISLFALIPLFAAEYIATKEKLKHFWLNYTLCFLLWNIATTYWIYYATLEGVIAAVIINTFQMSILFRIFRWFRVRFNNFIAYIGFAAIWVCWEHYYATWQISWPWLTLGNSFASTVKAIQWYEITGVLGGSVWIIIINSLIFKILLNKIQNKRIHKYVISFCVLFFIPITYSYIRYYSYKNIEKGQIAKEVVVLQPNIDPYNVKFLEAQDEQNDKLLSLAKEAITDSTFLIVAPETFFNPSPTAGRITENYPDDNKTFRLFKSFAKENGVNFIYGAVTNDRIFSKKAPGPTSIKIAPDLWQHIYNSAIFLNTSGKHLIYHKSKLVLMAETTPILWNKQVLKTLNIDLGGEIGNYTKQLFRTNFKTLDDITIGTAVCYESVFSDFYREYINNGANMMTIITNDGWWRNTHGHRQHLNYASIRAIETRRSIARSANTGISAIINQRGDIVLQSQWWKSCYIKGKLTLNNKITPFVKYGDIIGISCIYSSIILLLGALLTYLFGRKRI